MPAYRQPCGAGTVPARGDFWEHSSERQDQAGICHCGSGNPSFKIQLIRAHSNWKVESFDFCLYGEGGTLTIRSGSGVLLVTAVGRTAAWPLVTGSSSGGSAGSTSPRGWGRGDRVWRAPPRHQHRVWPCSRLNADVELTPPPIHVCGELFTGVSGNRIRVES